MRSPYSLIRSLIRRIPGVSPLRPPTGLKWIPFDPGKQAPSRKDRKNARGDFRIYSEEEL